MRQFATNSSGIQGNLSQSGNNISIVESRPSHSVSPDGDKLGIAGGLSANRSNQLLKGHFRFALIQE